MVWGLISRRPSPWWRSTIRFKDFLLVLNAYKLPTLKCNKGVAPSVLNSCAGDRYKIAVWAVRSEVVRKNSEGDMSRTAKKPPKSLKDPSGINNEKSPVFQGAVAVGRRRKSINGNDDPTGDVSAAEMVHDSGAGRFQSKVSGRDTDAIRYTRPEVRTLVGPDWEPNNPTLSEEGEVVAGYVGGAWQVILSIPMVSAQQHSGQVVCGRWVGRRTCEYNQHASKNVNRVIIRHSLEESMDKDISNRFIGKAGHRDKISPCRSNRNKCGEEASA